MIKRLLFIICIFLLPSLARAQAVGKLPAASSATGTQLPCATIGTSASSKGCTPAQIVSAGGGSSSSNTVNAGTGLTGGGVISSNPTLAVSFGTASGTVTQGNDSRITGLSATGTLTAATTAAGAQIPCATIGSTSAALGCTPAQIVSASGGLSGYCAIGGCQFTGGVGFAGTNLSQSSAMVVNNAAGGGYGGVWYMSNPSTGATNPAKYFRLDSTGNLQITNAANSSIISQISDAGIQSLFNSEFVVMPQTDGNRVEIDRDNSYQNYSGTHAALVVQQRDAEALGSNVLVPGAVFQFNVTGEGTVSLPSNSQSIWQGALFTMTKTNDGSGQAVTVIGQLEAVGSTGYNELGGFQGTITNLGSTNGYMSGYEFQEVDGGFDTHMDNVVSRMNRTVAGTKPNRNFVATSEGSAPPDAILQTLNAGYNTWKEGIDISGATFTNGIALALPNNTSIQFLSAGGVASSALLVSNANITFLTPVTSAGQACLGNSSFSKIFCEAGNNAVVVSHEEFAGGLASVTAGTGATAAGDDNTGRVTVGSSPGTTVALGFANSPASWTNAPICFAQDETTNVTLRATTVSTTGVTFTASGTLGAGDKVSYRCQGYQ